jgi:carboxyl-terminal processing protease
VLTIVSPLEDTPAFRLGLMPEDKVLKIDGVSTEGLDVEKCVEMLSGEPGTPVVLSIDRKGSLFDLTIVREKIKTRSVKGFHRDPADPQRWEYLIDAQRGIAYVRLTQFTPGLANEFLAALRDAGLDRGAVKGLIIDVRFNPGGLLSEAQAIADLFLKEGTIVSTKGRVYEEKITKAVEPGTLPEFPIIMMVNGESASASEILAGALAENNRAIVLGTRTFGKGSVQALLRLNSGQGSELKITEQNYYLPSGRSLTRKDDSAQWGVDPSPGFFVPMPDKQLAAMLSVRRQQERLLAAAQGIKDAPPADDAKPPSLSGPERWNDTAWVLEKLADMQLAAAVEAMQAKIDGGDWKKTGGDGPQEGAIAGGELAKARQFRERLVREVIRVDKRIDALEVAAKGQPDANARDFWPDAADITGGTLEVRDKDGKVIATLNITGNNLERWLLDADVEKPAEQAQPKAQSMAEPNALAPRAYFG